MAKNSSLAMEVGFMAIILLLIDISWKLEILISFDRAIQDDFIYWEVIVKKVKITRKWEANWYLCIQNCYLGKYQEQFERNKTVVQSERGLADSVRAILDRMGTPQCSAYKEAKMLQELFQYQPSG